MKVAITGSHGLIGGALADRLATQGHTITRLVRRGHRWDLDGLDGVDAVVHLAGEGIATRRWSAAHKTEIMRSRVEGTTWLANALAGRAEPTTTLIAGSAVGFYGDRGDEVLTERSGSGEGFLADVCRRWEGATAAAGAAGVRVVHVRTGIVLSHHGGALKRQLPLFRLGLGGRLGRGSQFMSWIALDDHVAAIEHCLVTPSISGPVNLTGPNPVTNAEFTATLGRTLRRPAVFAAPTWALRLVLGREFSDELLLASQRVLPEALGRSGFVFDHPTLAGALAAIIRPRLAARRRG